MFKIIILLLAVELRTYLVFNLLNLIRTMWYFTSSIDTSPGGASSAPLAALVLLLLPIPLLYPLGVLIVNLVFFKDKSEILVHLYVSLFGNECHNNEYCVGTHFTLIFPVYLLAGYCEVFWCCFFWRKGQIYVHTL